MIRKITLLLCLMGITTAFSQTLNFVNKANTLTARGGASSSKDTDFAYIVNGFNTTGANTSEIEKYTFASNTWSTLTTSIPTIARRYGNGEVLSGTMYLYNGVTATGAINDKVEMVNLSTGAVTVTSTLNPNPMYSAGSAVWGDRLLSFGGCSNKFNASYSSALYFVNPYSAWQQLADMPVGLQTKGEVVYGDGTNSKLYCFGGYRETNAIAETFGDVTVGTEIALNDWSNWLEAGTKAYKGASFSGNKYAQITAFDGTNPEASNITWLVSKPLSATGTDPVYLNFDTKDGFNNGATLQAYIITNWTGNLATSTKTLLTASIATGSTSGYATNFTDSGDVHLTGDLTEFRIGFKYVGGYSPTQKTTTYQLDNVRVFQTNSTNNIYIYDFASNQWSTSNTLLPQSISAYAVAKDDATDKMYITGDYNNQTFTGVYNPATDTFTNLSQTNMIGRRNHTSETWNGNLYIFGGNTTGSTSSSLLSVQSADLAVLGIGEVASNTQMSVYPNPVKDVLNISFDAPIESVAIYNLLGQQVFTKSFTANENSIDVSNLGSGTYFVKVAADNAVKTIKVIKE